MIDWLLPILGRDIYIQFISFGSHFIEQLICIVFFVWSFKRRKLFILRVIASIIFGFAVSIFLSWLRSMVGSDLTFWNNTAKVLIATAQMGIVLAILPFCFKETPGEIILCWCAIMAATQITGRGFSLLLNMFGVDDRASMSFFSDFKPVRDWTIWWVVHTIFYAVLGLFFGRKKKYQSRIKIPNKVIALSAIIVIVTFLIINIMRPYEMESLALTFLSKILAIVNCIIILILNTGIISRERYKQEYEIMDELLHQERKQYEQIKSNVEIINMKCHDLKHQLNKFEGRLTEEEIQSLKTAIEIYDSNIKTGNEILDVILYEKQLYCEKNDIKLTCMADGRALSFISATHLYSLFSNAINNAVEAVSKISESEKRVISISVTTDDEKVYINIINFFEGNIEIIENAPQTSKLDKNRHGYGLKSMKYITDQYNGNISITTDKGAFELEICFPLMDKKALTT